MEGQVVSPVPAQTRRRGEIEWFETPETAAQQLRCKLTSSPAKLGLHDSHLSTIECLQPYTQFKGE